MNNTLHYKTFGDAQSPPNLLILHGLLGDMDNWRSQARQLSDTQSIITTDLRNHGDSPHADGMSYGAMAGDVIRLLDELQLEHIDLLGHSMGGKVAMRLAIEYPERVSRLIVVDIAPRLYPPHHIKLLEALSSLPVATLVSRSDADKWLADKISDPMERMFLLKNLQRADTGGYEWKHNLAAINDDYDEISAAPFGGLHGDLRFDKATLFIRGEKSDYVDPEADLSLIKGYFPQATLETINDAGHLPHVENRRAFFEVLSDFLNA